MTQEEIKQQVQKLPETARRVRTNAKYAERNEYVQAELHEAWLLDQQANELEKQVLS